MMVDILRAYSKRSDLLEDLDRAVRGLARAAKTGRQPRRSVSSTGAVNRVWALSDRLSEEDIRGLVDGYRQGASMLSLSKQYGISDSSVKRIIRRQRAAGWVIEREVRKHG